jgi:hypothetical protein
MGLTKICNKIWLYSQQKDYNFFCKHLTHPFLVQQQCLSDYVQRNKTTVFGQQHGFKNIRNYEDFAKFVPIIEDYELFRPYVDEIAAGKSAVLIQEKTLFFESTSGSTAQSKLIPYTATLKKEFQKAVGIWMHDLNFQYESCFEGQAYWSLSPALKKSYKTEGGISVGIQDDTAYFNPFSAFLLKQIMAVPAAKLLKIEDTTRFYIETLKYLLAQEKLSFMSVWSPTFFLQMDQFLKHNFDFILKSISTSRTRKEKLTFWSKNGYQWQDLFPKLALVSCWADAQAALWIPEIQQRLGNIPIQGKGLLATEGVTTIPWGNGDPVLAYTSHFFEFRNVRTGEIIGLENLEIAENYEVILTTGGGLYRYATRDVVTMTGKIGACPRLKFQGRKGSGIDMVGEKLHETHVNQAITDSLKKYPIVHKGIFLYGVRAEYQAHYQVLIAWESDAYMEDFLKGLENHFCQNPYYQQARNLGQLGALELVKMPKDFSRTLLAHYKAQKQIRDGDVKLPLMFPPLSLDCFSTQIIQIGRDFHRF